MRLRAPLPLVALLLAGCHTFQPVTPAELAPGHTVRARVTGAYADSLDSVLQRDARLFEGVVVEARASSVVVDIPVQQELAGFEYRQINQRVEVPRSAFVDVELKSLDRRRTFGATAAAAAVVAAVAIAQLGEDSGGAPSPGVPGPQDIRLPWLRLVLPFR